MTETTIRARVLGLRWEAETVLSVELAALSEEPLPSWQPGAHVDVELATGLVRQYSLCGDPKAPTWTVAVLLEVGGRGGSTYVHEDLRPGHEVMVSMPRNHFELVPAPRYLFIAGGIGITPLLALVAGVDLGAAEWNLLYLGRSRRRMAFLDRLRRYGSRVEVLVSEDVGRPDISEYLDAVPHGTRVYCCGPPSLLEAVAEACDRAQLQCSVERFSPIMDAEAARSGTGFEVQAATSGISFFVEDGESILQVAERHGLRPPSSCMEGTCGTCETTVISGLVDHRDGILTDSERKASKTMMICVSRSTNPSLVLDL